ncbi:MAG: sensor histidine kinase [Clostridium sp.]
MNMKLTFRYVLSMAVVALLVVITNILILGFIMFYTGLDSKYKYENNYDVSDFVRNFEKYIDIDIDVDNNLNLSDHGKNLLDKKKSWIQILNEDSREVYNYNKPNIIKEKHMPIELINGYKYGGGFGDDSQILAGYKTIDNTTYTYLIGFPMVDVQKVIFITDTAIMIKVIECSLILIIVIDIIIAIAFGFIFSKGLTKPVKKIIGAVEDLYDGDYEVYYKEKGLYKSLFAKLNILSNKLKENEIERKKIETMREEWIDNISHDIKTPLSSIKGYAEVLEEDYDFSSEDIKDYAGIINKKADYIKELVDDLNLNVKLKNDISIVNKEEVNIVKLVQDSIIDIFNDSRYSNVDIEFECDEEEIKIEVDKMLIKRVLNNLIYNALVHNDDNINIGVGIYKNDKTHITISDNGKGISKEDLEHIFDRYYRGTNTGEFHKGSGLGMAIAKEVINAHNGDIIIKSELGKGTYIEIVL